MPVTRGASIALLAVALASGGLSARAPRGSWLAPNLLVQRGAPVGHAHVALLADSTLLPKAGELLLGLRFTIDNGWHIYWRNPGESGEPPAVVWQAPKGFTVGDLQWPVPGRVKLLGVTSYAYEHDVMLVAGLSHAAGAATGASVTITATVDYVVCSNEMCLKESAAPSTTLPVTAGPATPSASAAEFGRTKGRLPQPAPAGWKASATIGNEELTLIIDTGHSETMATFFPFEQGLIDDSATQAVQASARGFALRVKKSPFFLHTPAVLEGVLALPGAAFTIRAPLSK